MLALSSISILFATISAEMKVLVDITPPAFQTVFLDWTSPKAQQCMDSSKALTFGRLRDLPWGFRTRTDIQLHWVVPFEGRFRNVHSVCFQCFLRRFPPRLWSWSERPAGIVDGNRLQTELCLQLWLGPLLPRKLGGSYSASEPPFPHRSVACNCICFVARGQ